MTQLIKHKFTTNLKNTFIKAASLAINKGRDIIMPDDLFFALRTIRGGLAYDILTKNKLIKNNNNEEQKDLASRQTASASLQTITFSRETRLCLKKAAVWANRFQHSYVGTEHLLLALLENPDIKWRDFLRREQVNDSEIKKHLLLICQSTARLPSLTGPFKKEAVKTKRPVLKETAVEIFANDLTSAELDPVIARDQEIERLIQILLRRHKNNPVILGEAGVGKTALVEGLAQRIRQGKVPEALSRGRVLSLDLGLLVAGTMYRGEFEMRFKQILEEAKHNPDIIIFIDELHTIMGAGSTTGSLDMANLLKPALARGEIRCIGATTFADYRKFIENDPALERRFQPVILPEPSLDQAIKILQGLKSNYEHYHNIIIANEAIESAVRLSARHLPDRFLPDKAIDLIDEAAARKKIKGKIDPDIKKFKELAEEFNHLGEKKRKAVEEEQFEEALENKRKQGILEAEINELKKILDQKKIKPQGTIAASEITQLVSEITGVPLDDLINEEKGKLLALEKTLAQKIIGQPAALEEIANFIKRSRLGLADQKRPRASFLFLGPSGVGKTETAKLLADTLFEGHLIRIDMSEFAESFNISKLIGSPPGYVGYKESGKLTEKVRRCPYSIVLFDELEKAHSQVYNLLLQILEDGCLTDGAGRKIDFKNTIIILTANLGGRGLTDSVAGFSAGDKGQEQSAGAANQYYHELQEKITKETKKIFPPEFLNRLDSTIIFRPLNKNDLKKIVDLQLNGLKEKLTEKNIAFEIESSAKNILTSHSYNLEEGARRVRRVLQDMLEVPLAQFLLQNNSSKNLSLIISRQKGKLSVREKS